MALDKKEIRKLYTDIEQFLAKESGQHRCHCGCNEIIGLKKSHFWNGIPKYIFGHAARIRTGAQGYEKDLFYCVEDIAKLAGVSDQTIRLWNRKGKLRSAKTIGRKNLFLKSDIHASLKDLPKRKTFVAEDFVTVQELKRMGVSRSKLRILVREGKIQEPLHYARKTHYLREEISRFLGQLLEDPIPMRKPSRKPDPTYKHLLKKIDDLEQRVYLLEEFINRSMEFC